jgi:hypothetical protein
VYSAPEAEMLALVWATKYFRCYIYGKKFLVRTDHSALTYLRNFAENNSHLMRWSLRFELDFTVEHRASSKIAHLDALSRHVGAVIHQNGLNRKASSKNKEKTPSAKKVNPQNLLTQK